MKNTGTQIHYTGSLGRMEVWRWGRRVGGGKSGGGGKGGTEDWVGGGVGLMMERSGRE